MAAKLKSVAIDHGSSNGYITLEELTQIKPLERDETIDGKKYRVRGLMSGEIHQIGILCRRPGVGYDDTLDSILTTAFGIVRPDLGAKDDLVAARIIVEGFPKSLLAGLSTAIANLTNGIQVPVATPLSDHQGDEQQSDDRQGDGVHPEQDAQEANTGE